MDADLPLARSSEEASSPSRRRRWLILGGLAAVVLVGFVAIVVFGVHTLFIDDEVDEAAPTFRSGAKVSTVVDVDDAPAPTASPATGADDAATVPTTTTEPVPEVSQVATGSFEPVNHPGGGTVTLLSDGDQTFVRFEDDFSTDNGPDLYAVAYVGDRRIELGMLKGNQGSQNYVLPADVDPAAIDTVAVWCKRFDSTFTEAAVS